MSAVPNLSQAQLTNLARLAIRGGLNLQPGQELLVAVDVTQLDAARAVAEEAYRAGAKCVRMLFGDEQIDLARLNLGSEEAVAYAPAWHMDALAGVLERGGAYLRLEGSNPTLYQNVEPARIKSSVTAQSIAAKKLLEMISGSYSNWSIVPVASTAWAKQVFPDLPTDQAMDKLWQALLSVTRADQPDPVAAWKAHCDELETRRDALNALNLTALHFSGLGTDLRVGLVDGHKFVSGRMTCKNQIVCSPNIPTEEIFTMPHRERTEGTVRSTKPLAARGNVIEGIEMEFKAGKVVKATATKGQESLTELIALDEGMTHLGEVALVPESGAVAKSGLLFYNTLLDENAACHIALGQALKMNLPGSADMSEEQSLAHGMNASKGHTDWMIGSPQVDVHGILPDGSTQPIIKSGLWAI
jgi:aminopeptidase